MRRAAGKTNSMLFGIAAILGCAACGDGGAFDGQTGSTDGSLMVPTSPVELNDCSLLRQANAALIADPLDLAAAATAFRAAGDAGGLRSDLRIMATAFEAGDEALGGRPVPRNEMATLFLPSLVTDEYDAALNRYADYLIQSC